MKLFKFKKIRLVLGALLLTSLLSSCAPPPPGGSVWIPGHYGPYGGWHPGHYRPVW